MMHKLCLLLAIGFFGVGYGQKYSTSPFSINGLGEAGTLEDPQFGALGNTRVTVIDSATVNTFNPSSYSSLSKGQPLFSIGISSHFSRFSYQGKSSQGRVIGLNQITMVLPLGKRFGLAFALQPFTRKGYEIMQKDRQFDDSVFYTYRGKGSTQELLLGLSYKILSFKKHAFTIGVNYSYVFGTSTNERVAFFKQNYPVGGVDQISYRLHAGRLTTGANYELAFDSLRNQLLQIGAVYTPQQRLNANRDYALYTTPDISNPNVYQLLEDIQNDKGYIYFPSSLSLGFNYSFRPRKSERYQLKTVYHINVYGEYTSTRWSDYKTVFQGESSTAIFKNTGRMSLGVQFTPNFESHNRTVSKNYFSRIKYRAGTYFGSLPYIENGKQVSEIGFTCGLGLPIAIQRTNSSFNFSFLYGNRGSDASGLRERFFSFNIGVILAPSSYDKWFRKYKLD